MAITNNGSYIIEFEGIGTFEAVSVTFGENKHELIEIYTGGIQLPILGPGKGKVEELTIKAVHGLNSEAADAYEWYDNYLRGTDRTKRSGRIVTLGQDGEDLAIDEYIECIPTSWKPDEKKGEGKEASGFELKIRPSDHRGYY